jgi:peptidoglycan/xylan/chitin deacetylase (PgdA/CDA1 family)
MLAIYLFHYLREDGAPWSTLPSTMELHFQWLSRQGQTIHTGETIQTNRKSIILSFDDASYCFYHYVYPLLKRYALKAVLAVPSDFIPENVPSNHAFRLQPRVDLLLQKDVAPHPAFCSWQELHEMQSSGLVEIASHSRTHANLNTSSNLKEECEGSAQMIERKLGVRPRAFVLPFGKGSPDVIRTALSTYQHVLRIGNAWNRSSQSSLLYRVPCDDLAAGTLPKPGSLSLWRNYFWNQLRGK